MAPEYLAGLSDRSARSEPRQDIYALGLLLVELLTGQLPYPRREGSIVEILRAVIDDRRQLPRQLARSNPAITPAVEAIVLRCLQPDPKQRYQSARELREDIDCHLANLPLQHTREPSLRERFRKFRRRHPRALSRMMIALSGVLIVGLGSWMYVREQGRQRLEARTVLHDQQTVMRQIPFLLATPDTDPALIAEGLRLCEEQAQQYQLREANWAKRFLVQRLNPDDQQKLRQSLGEMLWLWARARSWKATTSEQRTELLALLSQARECYGREAVPLVLARLEAWVLQHLGRTDEARRAEQDAARVSATSRDEYLSMLEQIGQGKWRAVLPFLQETSRRESDNPMPWLLLARAHVALGQKEQARVYAEMATTLSPDWPWAWYHRGLTCLHMARHDEARTCFDRVLELQPGLLEARLNRAMAFLQLGQTEEAIADLDRLIEMDAPYTRIYFLRARARAQKGDLEGAQADHQEGLRREPSDELSWVSRGIAWLPGAPARALADLDRALESNPAAVVALRNKAHVLSEHLKRIPDAIKCLDRVLELHPDDLLARAGRAVLQARQGQRDLAHRDARLVAKETREAGLIYQAACTFALTAKKHPQDQPETLRLLRQAFRLEERWIDVAGRDPDLDALRGQEPFDDLLRRAKAWFRPGL